MKKWFLVFLFVILFGPKVATAQQVRVYHTGNYLADKHRAYHRQKYERKRMEYILRYKINKPRKQAARKPTKSKARYRKVTRIRRSR